MDNILNIDLLKVIAGIVIIASPILSIPLLKSFREIIKDLKEPNKTILHIKDRE